MRTRRRRHLGRRFRCQPVLDGLEARQLLAVTYQAHFVGSVDEPNFGALANSIVIGPDQNLWFTLSSENNNEPNGPAVGVLNSSTGVITKYPTNTDNLDLNHIPSSIVSGPDGDLWFIDTLSTNGAGFSGYDIASINPTTGAINEYPIAPPGAVLAGLAVGSDGNLWYTDSGTGAIGTFDVTTHASTEFALPNVGDNPTLITPGPNGDLFFTAFITESAIHAIGEINPTTHAITLSAFPNSQSVPVAITAGPDGNVWFNEQFGTGFKIGMLDPTTHAISEFVGGSSGGITTGPDGNLWYDGQGSLTQFDPTTHVATSFALPNGVQVPAGLPTIVAGPNNSLEFSAQNYFISADIVAADQSAITGFATQGSTLFLDLQGDGTLDPGDPVATPNVLGDYNFTGLAPGTYTVRLVVYPGTIITSPVGGGQVVTVAAGQVGVAGSFTVVPTSSILPLTYSAAPFGTTNPDVQTAEVIGLYRIILGRAPDPTGMTNAVAYLKSGGSLVQLSADLMMSPEYDGDTVQSYYQTYLDRAPTMAEQTAGVSFLEGGGTQEQLAAQIFNSAEFSTLFATDTAFVQQLYIDILGRSAEPAGLAGWLSLLSTGTTRAQVVNGILNSTESDARAGIGQYYLILGIPVDRSTSVQQIQFLQSGGTQLQLAVSIFSNPQFVARANATVM